MKIKNYIFILLSIIINKFGDILFDLFITWKITASTGEILNAVYLIGSSIVFRAILALFIGILVDNYNKKNLVIISNISSMIIMLIFCFIWNIALNNIWLGVLFILLNDINNEIFSRSYITMSAELFDKEQFVKFQAKCAIANRVIGILGSSLAGFLIAYMPDLILFLIDIVTFALSALLVGMVNYVFIKDKNVKTSNTIKHAAIHLVKDITFTFSSLFKSSYLLRFIVLMFILNLAYGYIPYILPLTISNENANSVLLGLIKSAMSIGEFVGLLMITKLGGQVSILFKISMIGNSIGMLLLMSVNNPYVVVVLFALYGMFDSLTQPLFGYTISSLDEKNRGKIIGGVDAIILLSPGIGMLLITKIMTFNSHIGYISLSIIFIIGYLIISFCKEMNNIIAKKEVR
jgi:MFS family permease